MKNYFKILTTILALMAVFLMPEMGWGQTTVTQTSFSAISGNVNNDAKVTYSAYKGAGTSAPAVNSNAIRLYQNSANQTGGYVVIGVPSGYVITSATIQSTMATTTGYILTNTDPGSDTPAKSSFAVNNYSLSANTDYTVNSISTRYITFACFGTTSSARLYLSKISVTYQSSGSTPTTYTVTFDAGTGTFDGNTDFPSTSNNIAAGTYTLPSATPSSVCASNGWTFAGWATASVGETTTAPTLLTGSYSPTSDLTLYAVYSITEGDGGTTTFNFADIASANNWENGVAYTSVEIPPITITAAGGGNNGKWYTSGGGSWRMYSGGTVNISGSDIAVTAVTSSPSCSFAISSGSASFSPSARTDFTNITVTYGSSTTSYATSPTCTALTATTTTIDDSGITNTDIYTSTNAGSLSATVTETESGNAVSGATVTWSSSDTDVATIDANGAVTLVGVGTTTITATYAGDADHGSSTGTYSLTVTNNAPVISADDVSIPYTATSFSIGYTITNPVTGGNLSSGTNSAAGGYWILNGNFDTEHNTVNYTCEANNTASARTAIITFTYTYGEDVIATKEVTVTQAADPNAFHKISDITAVGTYKIRGTIVAKSTRGFVVGDGTGYVYYYKGSEPSNNIGDMVKLEGSVVEFGGVFEFDNQTTITSATESNYHTENPMEIDGTMMDYILTSTETHLSYFVQYKGKLEVNTSKATHYNITETGATTAIGSISFPINTDFESLDGKNVIVTGYYVGKSSNKYINTMLGSIEENCDGTTVTITSGITNTDVYTSMAAGSLSATVTETESGDPVSGATVTWSSSNPSVATVDASGNVTLVAAGTTTITASYAGVAETYCESSATYELTVTDSTPICNSFGTINFGNGNNGTISINSASVTGSDSEGNTWTITTVGTTSFTPNGGYSQVGSGNNPAESITFTTTLPSAVKISDFSAKFGGYGSTAGTVTLKVGETVVGTGSLNGSNDVTIENITEAEGNTLTVIVTNIVAGVKCYYISYGVTVVAAPTFSLASGGYVGEQSVSIACETAGATIRYTTDGSDPTETSSVYSSAITVGAGVTTLKAKAYYEDCESSIAEATYTICTAAPNAPIISISGDECDNTRTVTITGEGNVTIYYTTDGTDPTTASAVYSSPFNLTSTTTVKAIAVDNDCPSGIAMEICNIMALSGDYEKVTSNLTDWSGEYVIAHSGTGDTRVLSGCSSYGSSTSYGTYHSVSTTSNVLASADVDTYKVIIEKVAGTSTYTIKKGNYYISYTGSGNYLEFYTDTTNYTAGSARWTITRNGSNTVITNVRESNRQIMYNASQPRFACYTGTQQPIDLFKKVQGTATVSVVAGENIKGVWIEEDDVAQTTLNTTVCNEVTFHATVAPGYTFVGWYNNVTDELVSTDIDYTHVVKGDITLRAEAELVEMLTVKAAAITPYASESGPFAVEVDINGGTHGQTASASVAEGSSVTFNATMLDSDHYVFDGWYYWKQVGDDMVFRFATSNPSYTVTITDTITYYAIARNVELWTDVVYEAPDSWTWNGTDDIIHITCAEDMAWLISVVNGFNGCTPNDLSGKTVQVDVPVIDMYAHIWVPIGYGSGTGDNKLKFSGTFDGGRCLITGVHIDRRADETLVVETSSHVEYAPGFSDSPYGPMMYAGIFGYTEGATVKNINLFLGDGGLEQCPNDWITCTQNGGYLGSMVAYGKDLDMECCSMLNGVVAYANLNSIGGLVGYATSENPSAHSIKACMANAHIGVDESCTANYFGGLVGYCNYAVKDCFAMPCDLATKYGSGLSGTITYKGAAVGYGTTTSNVYAHPYATANGFTKIDGSETGELLYALTSNYTDATSTFSASEERRYGNYSTNNTIGGRPFADVLNDNVTEGFKWMTPPTKNVNGGYPLIVRESDLSSAVFSAQDPGQYFLGVLNTGLDKLMPIILQIVGDDEEEDEGDKISGKSNNRTDGAGMGVFMYSSGDISFAVPEGFLYIDENVAVTQSVDDDVYAFVGVTLDNSAGAGNEHRDWHMFSSAIEAGKIGINYGSQNTESYEENLTFGTDYDFMQGDPAVYFPDGITTAATAKELDVYSFFEPEYHWINLKRATGNHWHEDNTSDSIAYGPNETTFKPGKGYLVALGNNTTKNNNFMQASGVLNNGEVSATLTSAGEHLKGYNLLGNPYQSYLDFNKFAEVNGDHIWSSTSDTGYMSYLVYNADAGGFEEYLTDGYQSFSQGAAQTKSQYINMHQGFFVVKKNGTDGQVKFNNGMRVTEIPSDYTGAQPSFRNAHNYPLVNLFCTDSDGKREVSVIEVDRPANAGSLKMKGMLSGKGQMYLHWGSDDFGSVFIDHTPDYVPVWFEAVEDGVFTMSWNTANDDFGYLHLVDNLTGNDIDMLASDSYSFEAQVSDSKARFRLVFKPLGIEEQTGDGGENFAFVNGSELVVTGEGELSLIDLNGRVLATEYVSGQQSHITMPVVAEGMYMLRLTKANDVRVQKIVIRK